MKKVLTTLFAVVLAVACLACAVSAADVSVDLDGKKLDFEQPPVIIEGRTLVPLRAIFEALGASVEWDGATKTVTSVKEDVTIKLTIGSNVLYRNGEGKELDVPAQIVGEGYTMVPARAIAEAYGVTVDWDDATKTVLLTSPVKKVEGAIVEKLVADNYTPDSRYYTTGTPSKDLVVVANPLDANDKVFFIESNITGKNSWTYFWVNKTQYVPGTRYIVEYDILAHDLTSDGVPVTKFSLGMNFRYGLDGEAAKDNGATSDGKASTIVAETGKWTHVVYVNTIPANVNPTSDMKFGIYANPKEGKNFSYYVDNLSILPYEGNYSNGVVDMMAVEASKIIEGVDFTSLDGIVYDFDENFEPFNVDKAYSPVVENGHLVLTVPEGASTDVQANAKIEFSADEYKMVAFKVKCDSEAFKKSHFSFYFATEAEPKLSQTKCIMKYYNTCALTEDGYYVGCIDLSTNGFWTGKITAIRIDPMQEVYGTVSIDKIVLYK